jgi:hypothetical protein
MAILGELKYWNNGEPVLPDDAADIKALKYWLNGEPYFCAYAEGAPPAGTNIKINIGDIFKDVDSLKINIGGVWKDVVSAELNIGGVWKNVFS